METRRNWFFSRLLFGECRRVFSGLENRKVDLILSSFHFRFLLVSLSLASSFVPLRLFWLAADDAPTNTGQHSCVSNAIKMIPERDAESSYGVGIIELMERKKKLLSHSITQHTFWEQWVNKTIIWHSTSRKLRLLHIHTWISYNVAQLPSLSIIKFSTIFGEI